MNKYNQLSKRNYLASVL